MKIFQIGLALFLIVICFAFVPNANGALAENIYSLRLPLLAMVLIIGNLWLFSIKSRGLSAIGYLKKNINWKLNPLIIILVAYIIWILVAAAFSPFSGFAFLGYPDLQFGGLLLIVSLGLLLLYTHLNRSDLSIRVLTSITLLMCVITILEAIGIHPLEIWIHSPHMVYPASILGHRPHLGGWYAILTLVPIFFYRNRSYDTWFWIWISSAIIGLGLTTTSAASVGVGVGFLIWLALNIKSKKYHPVFMIIVAFVLSITTLPSLSTSLGNTLGLSPGGFKDYLSTGSFKPRLYLWKAAINASLERPVFGWGDETFGFEVFKHLSKVDGENLLRAELSLSEKTKISYSGSNYYTYDTVTKKSGQGNLLYIRAHNVLFDELYARGYVGLILFTLLIVSFLRYIYRLDRRSFPFFVLALLPYSIYLMAWFYIPTVTPLFFIVIGLMISDLRNSRTDLAER